MTDVCDRESTKYHEMGHSIQNAIFGPFAILIAFVPSFIRCQYRNIKYYNRGKSPATKYDDIWFEKSATDCGNLIKSIIDEVSANEKI